MYVGAYGSTALKIGEASRFCVDRGYAPMVAKLPHHRMLSRVSEQNVVPTCAE